jgi:two-component system LytT family response regulator
MTAPESRSIRVLVVDDELPARQRLLDLLRHDPLCGEILEAENGLRAVDLIQSLKPDLVFLDVQMPELDGLGVIDAVGPERMPFTVFVTAYEQHAIRAFEANALDYLLKPYSDERFEAAMARFHNRRKERDAGEFEQRLLQLISTRAPRRGWLDRLVIKSGGSTRFVRAAEVDWFEAAGVYVNVHVSGQEFLYRSSLNELAGKLDPMRFIRVHRSAIVNIESIVQLNPISHGEFEAVLKDGSRPRVSRSYRPNLESRLGQSL